ncbi:MAG: hypothetical protein V3T81_06675, partial [Thermoanaerobaculia bacterium]
MTLRSGLAVALLLAASWTAAATQSFELVQPAESPNGLILATGSGRAYVEDGDGHRRRIPLRRDERLTELVEAGAGWIVAGVRDTSVHQQLVLFAEEGGRIRRLPAPPDQRT